MEHDPRDFEILRLDCDGWSVQINEIMKITRNVLVEILNCPSVPPETGGIIGGTNGIVTEFIFDAGIADLTRAVYTPDVNRLNECIRKWANGGIEWMGMLHSHPIGQERLSSDDLVYVEKVLSALPLSHRKLYFPIIVPRSKLIPYYAYKRKALPVKIVKESLDILDT